MITTVEIVAVKMTFNAIGYDLFNLLGEITKRHSGSYGRKLEKHQEMMTK